MLSLAIQWPNWSGYIIWKWIYLRRRHVAKWQHFWHLLFLGWFQEYDGSKGQTFGFLHLRLSVLHVVHMIVAIFCMLSFSVSFCCFYALIKWLRQLGSESDTRLCGLLWWQVACIIITTAEVKTSGHVSWTFVVQHTLHAFCSALKHCRRQEARAGGGETEAPPCRSRRFSDYSLIFFYSPLLHAKDPVIERLPN